MNNKIPKLTIGLKLARTKTKKPRLNTILGKIIALPVLDIALAIALLISFVHFASDCNLDKK